MTDQTIDYDRAGRFTFTESVDGWRGHDHQTGHRTRPYDTLIELNAAVCDGTAQWTAP